MQIDTSVFVFTLDGVETAEDVFNSSFNCEIFSPSSFKVFIMFALSSGFMFLFFSSLDISIYKINKKVKLHLVSFNINNPYKLYSEGIFVKSIVSINSSRQIMSSCLTFWHSICFSSTSCLFFLMSCCSFIASYMKRLKKLLTDNEICQHLHAFEKRPTHFFWVIPMLYKKNFAPNQKTAETRDETFKYIFCIRVYIYNCTLKNI